MSHCNLGTKSGKNFKHLCSVFACNNPTPRSIICNTFCDTHRHDAPTILHRSSSHNHPRHRHQTPPSTPSVSSSNSPSTSKPSSPPSKSLYEVCSSCLSPPGRPSTRRRRRQTSVSAIDRWSAKATPTNTYVRKIALCRCVFVSLCVCVRSSLHHTTTKSPATPQRSNDFVVVSKSNTYEHVRTYVR